MKFRHFVYRMLVKYVLERKAPDLLIGSINAPSMERWRLFSSALFGLYVHRFLRDDSDYAMHDHPWASLSWLISGSYIEYTEGGSQEHFAGKICYRSATYRHRICVSPGHEDIVTLFFVGRNVRKWGFWHGDKFEPFSRSDNYDL